MKTMYENVGDVAVNYCINNVANHNQPVVRFTFADEHILDCRLDDCGRYYDFKLIINQAMTNGSLTVMRVDHQQRTIHFHVSPDLYQNFWNEHLRKAHERHKS